MVSNSAAEEFGIDAVTFTDASGAVVTQQDFENMGGALVASYPNFYGGVNTAHPNYGVSSTGVPKWICSDGSEIDIDLMNNGVNDCLTGADESATNWYIDTNLENTATATVSWGGDGVRLDSDDDNDGFNDGSDLCPGTPQGVTVYEGGCSAEQGDNDEDGIRNDLDLCAEVAAVEAFALNFDG